MAPRQGVPFIGNRWHLRCCRPRQDSVAAEFLRVRSPVDRSLLDPGVRRRPERVSSLEEASDILERHLVFLPALDRHLEIASKVLSSATKCLKAISRVYRRTLRQESRMSSRWRSGSRDTDGVSIH